MTNDAFAKILADVEKQAIAQIMPATELLVGEDKLTDVLKGDFQLQHIRKITPFFNGSVQLPEKMFDLIQTSNKEIVNFQVISFLSENEVYLLVILDLEFYSLKSEANDPFREFEEFDIFATQLKPLLGLRHVESFESDDGFYYTNIEINSKIHTAFLYKV